VRGEAGLWLLAFFNSREFQRNPHLVVNEIKTGFKVSDAATGYANSFLIAVRASEFLESAGGFSITEYSLCCK